MFKLRAEVIKVSDGYLAHIGNENSGRYPRGSGKNPYQRDPARRKKTTNVIQRALSGAGSKKSQNESKSGEPYKKMTAEELMKTRNAAKVYAHKTDFTDKELRDWVNRMNLEISVKKMSEDQKKDKNAKAKKVIDNILAAGKTMNEVYKFATSPVGIEIQKTLGVKEPIGQGQKKDKK